MVGGGGARAGSWLTGVEEDIAIGEALRALSGRSEALEAAVGGV